MHCAKPPICLIVNPAAGGGRAGRLAAAVRHALEAGEQEVRCESAIQRERVRVIANRAALDGETVVTLGGDGIVGAAAQGMHTVPQALLGIVPAGRGNDLARALGIPRDPIAACKLVAGGHAFDLDLGEIDGRVFVGIASVGFDSDANRIANGAPSWMGRSAYAYGALRALASWRCATFDVELRDVDAAAPGPSRRNFHFRGYSAALANSPYYGGGMRLAPGALLDDGRLDVVVIEQMSRARFLCNLPRVFGGGHVGLAAVRTARTVEARIAADRPFTIYADGDPIAELPVRVRVLPGALRVLAGEPRASALSAPGSAGARVSGHAYGEGAAQNGSRASRAARRRGEMPVDR